MRRIYPSDIIVGASGGLFGLYIGLSREAAIGLVVLFSLAQFGASHLYRRWKEARNA